MCVCENPALLFHVDIIYLAKQVKRDVERSFTLIWMKTITKSNREQDFLSFMTKAKKLSRCFDIFSSGPEQFTHGMSYVK